MIGLVVRIDCNSNSGQRHGQSLGERSGLGKLGICLNIVVQFFSAAGALAGGFRCAGASDSAGEGT
jgi:hypothetical protein